MNLYTYAPYGALFETVEQRGEWQIGIFMWRANIHEFCVHASADDAIRAARLVSEKNACVCEILMLVKNDGWEAVSVPGVLVANGNLFTIEGGDPDRDATFCWEQE